MLHHGDPDRPSVPAPGRGWSRSASRWWSPTGSATASAGRAPPASIDGLRPDSAGFSGHIRRAGGGHREAPVALDRADAPAADRHDGGRRDRRGGADVHRLPPSCSSRWASLGATEGIQGGNFDTRVERSSNDEFGTLAEGFNEMADHLQQMYRGLEAKVSEKTAQLEEKRAPSRCCTTSPRWWPAPPRWSRWRRVCAARAAGGARRRGGAALVRRDAVAAT